MSEKRTYEVWAQGYAAKTTVHAERSVVSDEGSVSFYIGDEVIAYFNHFDAVIEKREVANA